MTTRKGDEIVVAGHFVHTGTPVVLWMDSGGYDAYRVERRFSPIGESDWAHSTEEVPELRTPNRYSLRLRGLSDEEIEKVRGGGWNLPLLQRVVDQFVIHFDVCGLSRECFKVLHDHRGLSVHFMLDLDGTIYNNRSVGIEIANMGDYASEETNPLNKWYAKGEDGRVRITIPEELGDGGIRTKHFVGHPAKPELVHGNIQDKDLVQYDFTPEQYRALTRLAATLCRVFPKIKCDYPKDAQGHLIPRKLSDDDLEAYQGILGHYHIQTNKTDPGPAFQWDRVISEAQRLLMEAPEPADATAKGHPAKTTQ